MSPVVYLVAILGIILVVCCTWWFGEKPKHSLQTEEDVRDALHRQYPDFEDHAILLSDDRELALVLDQQHNLLAAVFPHGLFVVARTLNPATLQHCDWQGETGLSLRFSDFDRKEYKLTFAELPPSVRQQWQGWLERWQRTVSS